MITERKEGEAHLRLLMRELTHRSKNLLAVIPGDGPADRAAGWLDQGFLKQFNARLQALSASHDLLVRESWHGASLRELVKSQLSPYLEGRDARMHVKGPSVILEPEVAQGLGLALHELAENAVKYGALSVPSGTISISWDNTPPGDLDGVWNGQHGPAAKPRRKRGFGTLVIEHNLVRALNADVNWAFDPAGARCEMRIPAAQLLNAR